MFPEYCKLSNAEDVFSYHGYDTIPAYRKLSLENPSNQEQTAAAIKSINDNSCGYIESNEINYHLCDSNAYFINTSDKFVFAYFQGEYYKGSMPVLLMLEFLKYKAEKIMLVFEDTNFVIKKTEETYRICEKLDEIFTSSSFFEKVFIKSISNDQYEMIFYKLIEIFCMKYMNKDSRKLYDLDVMLNVLKFEIS